MEMEELTMNDVKLVVADQVLLNVQLQQHIEKQAARITELEEQLMSPYRDDLNGVKEGVTSGT